MLKKTFSPNVRNALVLIALCCTFFTSAQNPVFPPLDTIPVLDSLVTDEQVNEFAVHLAAQGAAIRDIFDFQAANSTATRDSLEQQLQLAKQDSTVGAEDRKAMEKALKAAKATEKEAQKIAKNGQKAVAFSEKITGMAAADQRKNLLKAYKNIAALLPKPPTVEEPPISDLNGSVAVNATAEPVVSTPAAEPADTALLSETATPADSSAESGKASKNKRDKKQAVSGPKFKSYDPASDVMLNPPARPCQLLSDTRDEFSGERRRELGKEQLFRYTNPSLKNYFTDRDHILCDAALSTNNAGYLLNLTFTINDINARRSFGSLPRNGVAILKLLDGETHTLYNMHADEGQPDSDNKVFTFRGQYLIEPGMYKKMQKTLLDKVRIAWSTGYEDYDVQNVDLLVRQLTCLMKN